LGRDAVKAPSQTHTRATAQACQTPNARARTDHSAGLTAAYGVRVCPIAPRATWLSARPVSSDLAATSSAGAVSQNPVTCVSTGRAHAHARGGPSRQRRQAGRQAGRGRQAPTHMHTRPPPPQKRSPRQQCTRRASSCSGTTINTHRHSADAHTHGCTRDTLRRCLTGHVQRTHTHTQTACRHHRASAAHTHTH
jgi:hypothetical protein